jgi:transposase-like protein
LIGLLVKPTIVSTNEIGGHMNTKQGSPAGRRRRLHSAEFKAKVVEACTRPGVSMAAVALAHGLNANLLRRWVVEKKSIGLTPGPATSPPQQEFLALPLVTQSSPAAGDIRIELRRGATTVTISWPAQAAGECAAWLREWLR